MSYDADPIFCGICNRAVNRLSPNHGGPVIGFEHGAEPADGHSVHPVPLSELPEAIVKCDFCSSEGPIGSPAAPAFSYRAGNWTSTDRNIVSETYDRADRNQRAYAAKPIKIVTEAGLDRDWGERWAACLPCARLIEARDMMALISRVTESLPAKYRRGKLLLQTRGHLIDQYEHFFATLHTTGRWHLSAEHPNGQWEQQQPGF